MVITRTAAAQDSQRMEKSFETSITELEEIVAKLEDGDLPLEASLELLSRGSNCHANAASG